MLEKHLLSCVHSLVLMMPFITKIYRRRKTYTIISSSKENGYDGNYCCSFTEERLVFVVKKTSLIL